MVSADTRHVMLCSCCVVCVCCGAASYLASYWAQLPVGCRPDTVVVQGLPKSWFEVRLPPYAQPTPQQVMNVLAVLPERPPSPDAYTKRRAERLLERERALQLKREKEKEIEKEREAKEKAAAASAAAAAAAAAA